MAVEQPLTVSISRWKMVMFVPLSLLLAALTSSLLLSPDLKDKLVGVAGILLFGGGSVVFVIMAVWPARYVIDDRGITSMGLGRTWTVDWVEVNNFRVIRPPVPRGRAPAMVGFDLTDAYKGGHKRMRALGRMLAGVDGALQPNLTIPPTQLADILNARRAEALNLSEASSSLSERTPVG